MTSDVLNKEIRNIAKTNVTGSMFPKLWLGPVVVDKADNSSFYTNWKSGAEINAKYPLCHKLWKILENNNYSMVQYCLKFLKNPSNTLLEKLL